MAIIKYCLIVDTNERMREYGNNLIWSFYNMKKFLLSAALLGCTLTNGMDSPIIPPKVKPSSCCSSFMSWVKNEEKVIEEEIKSDIKIIRQFLTPIHDTLQDVNKALTALEPILLALAPKETVAVTAAHVAIGRAASIVDDVNHLLDENLHT